MNKSISFCRLLFKAQTGYTKSGGYYHKERYQRDINKLASTEYYQYLATGRYPLKIPKAISSYNHTKYNEYHIYKQVHNEWGE